MSLPQPPASSDITDNDVTVVNQETGSTAEKPISVEILGRPPVQGRSAAAERWARLYRGRRRWLARTGGVRRIRETVDTARLAEQKGDGEESQGTADKRPTQEQIELTDIRVIQGSFFLDNSDNGRNGDNYQAIPLVNMGQSGNRPLYYRLPKPTVQSGTMSFRIKGFIPCEAQMNIPLTGEFGRQIRSQIVLQSQVGHQDRRQETAPPVLEPVTPTVSQNGHVPDRFRVNNPCDIVSAFMQQQFLRDRMQETSEEANNREPPVLVPEVSQPSSANDQNNGTDTTANKSPLASLSQVASTPTMPDISAPILPPPLPSSAELFRILDDLERRRQLEEQQLALEAMHVRRASWNPYPPPHYSPQRQQHQQHQQQLLLQHARHHQQQLPVQNSATAQDWANMIDIFGFISNLQQPS